LSRRLGGTQILYGHGTKEIIPAPSEIERQVIQTVFCFRTAKLLGVAVELVFGRSGFKNLALVTGYSDLSVAFLSSFRKLSGKIT
jgi:hypothetical protein